MTPASLLRLLIAVTVVLSIETLLPTQSSAQEPSTTIDFENYPANRTGTPSARGDVDFYRDDGLVFVRPVTGLVYDDQSVPSDPTFPRSGSTVITSCYSAEFCSNDIEMQLLSPHQRVQLWVGYDRRLSSAALLLFEGFDENGRRVAVDRVEMGPSERPIPVGIPLLLDDPERRISGLRLRWQDEGRFLSGLSVDDLELTAVVAAASAAFSENSIVLDGSNGPVNREIELQNTGNVTLTEFVVNLEASTVPTSPNPLTVDASACDRPLSPDTSCVVSIRYAGTENGGRQARLMARDATGRPLASATVEAFFDASTSDTTGEQATTTSIVGGSTFDGDPDEDRSTTDPATIGGGILLLLVMGALVGLRRPWRRRSPSPTPTPPAPEPQPPSPAVRPTVQMRPGTESSEVLAGRGPLVSLRASIDIGEGEIIIEERPRPNAPTPPSRNPAPEGSLP